jgi:hypothetical protein
MSKIENNETWMITKPKTDSLRRPVIDTTDEGVMGVKAQI